MLIMMFSYMRANPQRAFVPVACTRGRSAAAELELAPPL